MDTTSMNDKYERTFTTIYCKHAEKCRQITERFSETTKAGGK